MSTYEDQYHEDKVVCPYCSHWYQPECEGYSEDEREEQCGECGKKYRLHEMFTVTHITVPDCELNGQEHQWETSDRAYKGNLYDHCEICEACRRTP